MSRRSKDPDDPEVIEGILERIHNRTREEWIEWIKWRPEGYQDPDGEEDPWKEFLAREAAKTTDREVKRAPGVRGPRKDEKAA
ncbi:MAG TPA: hypothetical protein VFJ58_29160 [Armatimonadota bacterium]|nr:hypothetical protein [Armatimonadota bacterium]